MSDNLDGPSVEVTPAMAEEQERMQRTAALAAYYHTLLTQERLPDALVNELVVGWQASYLESELID